MTETKAPPYEVGHSKGERTQCPSCGAPIMYLMHERTMRLAPIDLFPNPNGNLQIDGMDGTYKVLSKSEQASQTVRYCNHYATCLYALEQHRPAGLPEGIPELNLVRLEEAADAEYPEWAATADARLCEAINGMPDEAWQFKARLATIVAQMRRALKS